MASVWTWKIVPKATSSSNLGLAMQRTSVLDEMKWTRTLTPEDQVRSRIPLCRPMSVAYDRAALSRPKRKWSMQIGLTPSHREENRRTAIGKSKKCDEARPILSSTKTILPGGKTSTEKPSNAQSPNEEFESACLRIPRPSPVLLYSPPSPPKCKAPKPSPATVLNLPDRQHNKDKVVHQELDANRQGQEDDVEDLLQHSSLSPTNASPALALFYNDNAATSVAIKSASRQARQTRPAPPGTLFAGFRAHRRAVNALEARPAEEKEAELAEAAARMENLEKTFFAQEKGTVWTHRNHHHRKRVSEAPLSPHDRDIRRHRERRLRTQTKLDHHSNKIRRAPTNSSIFGISAAASAITGSSSSASSSSSTTRPASTASKQRKLAAASTSRAKIGLENIEAINVEGVNNVVYSENDDEPSSSYSSSSAYPEDGDGINAAQKIVADPAMELDFDHYLATHGGTVESLSPFVLAKRSLPASERAVFRESPAGRRIDHDNPVGSLLRRNQNVDNSQRSVALATRHEHDLLLESPQSYGSSRMTHSRGKGAAKANAAAGATISFPHGDEDDPRSQRENGEDTPPDELEDRQRSSPESGASSLDHDERFPPTVNFVTPMREDKQVELDQMKLLSETEFRRLYAAYARERRLRVRWYWVRNNQNPGLLQPISWGAGNKSTQRKLATTEPVWRGGKRGHINSTEHNYKMSVWMLYFHTWAAAARHIHLATQIAGRAGLAHRAERDLCILAYWRDYAARNAREFREQEVTFMRRKTLEWWRKLAPRMRRLRKARIQLSGFLKWKKTVENFVRWRIALV
ncbi:unnamed protein product [Amoebophrya sp. A25]|nr:unnamed protein product [Amoebophrya sp. A25]|eukprot:GSA25T00002013001.1